MSDNRKAFDSISEILEFQLEAARGVFATLTVQIRDVEKRLKELNESAQPDGGSAGVAFAATGADLVWRRWIESRRSQILQELVDIKALREDAREALRIANGRAKSFEAVARIEQAKHAQTRARKEQRQSELSLIAYSLNH